MTLVTLFLTLVTLFLTLVTLVTLFLTLVTLVTLFLTLVTLVTLVLTRLTLLCFLLLEDGLGQTGQKEGQRGSGGSKRGSGGSEKGSESRVKFFFRNYIIKILLCPLQFRPFARSGAGCLRKVPGAGPGVRGGRLADFDASA